LKIHFGISAIAFAIVLALATTAFAQTRNGTQSGASSGDSNSQKDLPSSGSGKGGVMQNGAGGSAK
jgi:hypothetical protein